MALKRVQHKLSDLILDALNAQGLVDAYHSCPSYQMN